MLFGHCIWVNEKAKQKAKRVVDEKVLQMLANYQGFTCNVFVGMQLKWSVKEHML